MRLRRRVEEVERLEEERSQADAALRESEARLRDFAAAASDWFWEMDSELRFCFMSERLREVTGVDPRATIGKSRQDIGAGDTDADKWEAHLADLQAHRPFRDFRYVYVAENGVHVHDLQATILHLLGIDHKRLTYRYLGRDFRLTDVHGRVVQDILT